MTYEEIYSQFYSKQTDHTFFQKYSKEEAYELMRSWLHTLAADPHVRKCFSSLLLEDNIMELTYQLKQSIDDQSDAFFVKDIFSDGLTIGWLKKQTDTIVNAAAMIGGKEEKVLLNNYKTNISRLNELRLELRKKIRDRGYLYNENLGDA